MTDKEKILVKIESLLSETNHEPFTDEVFGRIQSLKEMKSYIESMQDEPCNHCKGHNNKEECDALVFGHNCPIIKKSVSKDLEKAAMSYGNSVVQQVCDELSKEYDGEYTPSEDSILLVAKYFKAGAEWQKEKDNEEKVLTYKHGFEDCKKQVSEDSKKELPKVWNRETLDEYVYQVAYDLSNDWMRETATWDDVETAVRLGAKWQKEHLWKHADGDDLPGIDKEVIALLNSGKVVFAHRPYKGKYIGKSLATGNIETFENETYDKGGWNQPNVKWWLDCGWPNKEE